MNSNPARRGNRCGRFQTGTFVVVLLSLLAAACSTIGPESMAFVDAEQTTLRIASPRIEGFETAIARWERDHPTVDVDVVLDSADDHHEWLREGANGAVDILAFEGNYSAEARAMPEMFVDLRDHGLADREEDFLAARWAEGIAETGELIALPIDADAHVLIVREDLLQPLIAEALIEATNWCDIIQAGNDFGVASNIAFFGDSEEFLRAVISQGRSSLLSADGVLDTSPDSELLRSWNLAMLTIGRDPVGPSPCPQITSRTSIARDLTPGEPIWNAEIASDDFAAVISTWSDRERISQASPESGGNWLTIALPVDDSVGSGTSSEFGLQFGIAADSPNLDIALDFLLTITSPVIQRSIFADGLGPLPAISAPYDDGSVAAASDGFLVGTPTIGDVWAGSVLGRTNEIAPEERPIVNSALLAALARVQGGLETPEEAWLNALNEMTIDLGQREEVGS